MVSEAQKEVGGGGGVPSCSHWVEDGSMGGRECPIAFSFASSSIPSE